MDTRLFHYLVAGFITAILLTSPLQAQEDDSEESLVRYVSDKIYVPLRSGPSPQNRVTHRGLPSGTRVTITATEENGKYTKVATRNGTEGWIPNQYLQKSKTAADKLDAAKKGYIKQKAINKELSKRLAELKKSNNASSSSAAEFKQSNEQLTQELAELKELTANTVKIHRDNKMLQTDNQRLKDDIDLLKADNDRLRNAATQDQFLHGALAVFLGMLMTLIIRWSWPKKKSEWN